MCPSGRARLRPSRVFGRRGTSVPRGFDSAPPAFALPHAILPGVFTRLAAGLLRTNAFPPQSKGKEDGWWGAPGGESRHATRVTSLIETKTTRPPPLHPPALSRN